MCLCEGTEGQYRQFYKPDNGVEEML